MQFKAVLFDVDGVLLDSLPEHLRFCQDQSDSLGLGLHMPDVATFRSKIARTKMKATPMKDFLLAVDVPKEKDGSRPLDLALIAYETRFHKEYPPGLFDGVPDLLKALAADGIPLGIVTANIQANVGLALGESLRVFDDRLTYFKDTHPRASKSRCITMAAQELSVSPGEILYVGDQRKDWEAAQDAGCAFLGVTYGWGIGSGETRFSTVSSPAGILDFIRR